MHMVIARVVADWFVSRDLTGELGTGDTTPPSPLAVPINALAVANAVISAVSLAESSTCFIAKTSGPAKIYCVGLNQHGETGELRCDFHHVVIVAMVQDP